VVLDTLESEHPWGGALIKPPHPPDLSTGPEAECKLTSETHMRFSNMMVVLNVIVEGLLVPW